MDAFCFCDFDPAEFYHLEMRKARKPHQCHECGRTIEIGETYEHVRGKWDGSVDTYRSCPRCLALREWVKAHVPCFCWHHTNMREDALDCAQHYSRQAPGLLFGAYRREIAIMKGRRWVS
jgi:hypothetical protein